MLIGKAVTDPLVIISSSSFRRDNERFSPNWYHQNSYSASFSSTRRDCLVASDDSSRQYVPWRGNQGFLQCVPVSSRMNFPRVLQINIRGKGYWRDSSAIIHSTLGSENKLNETEGITPRVARVAPGQAVVFAVYEKVKRWIEEVKSEIKNSDFNEH